MTAPAGRQPIVAADPGPSIRLAAAELLDTLRGLDRRIVRVDRVEAEVTGDASKPFTPEIAAWLAALGEPVQRVETVTGIGVQALRARPAAPEGDALLKSALRASGEQALREFVARRHPPSPFLDVDFPVTSMTTPAFAATASRRGIDADAVAAPESIAGRCDLKPAPVGEIDPGVPVDLRTLPAPMPEG